VRRSLGHGTPGAVVARPLATPVGDTPFAELDKAPLLDEDDEVPEPTPATGKQSSLTTVYGRRSRAGGHPRTAFW